MSKELDKDLEKDLNSEDEDYDKELYDSLSEEDIQVIEDLYIEDLIETHRLADDLMTFLDSSVSMYHAVDNSVSTLLEERFEELKLTEKWNLNKGGKYFLVVNNSTVMAFVVGNDLKKGFRIVGAHTDSPGFKVKANPFINKEGYVQLNTEVYGGPLLNTWFDRPLSIAGRVFLKGDSVYDPEVELINFDQDLMTIPSLAIHMFRDKNEMQNVPNPQKHTLPILGLGDEFDLNELIAEILDVDEEDIISHDLFIYNREKASLIGPMAEFIQSPRIDNLAMVHAGLLAIVNAEPSDYTQVFVAFDNEEIGSATQQGAASSLFRDVLKKISLTGDNKEDEFINQIYDSFMISADQAHAIHPNYSDKADPTNKPKMNDGPVIKDSARKSYATDAYGRAVLVEIAENAGIPIQYFHNRSDSRGGSTIGAIIETNTGIRNIDIGNPMLAMHSSRELSGIADQVHMLDLMIEFFESK